MPAELLATSYMLLLFYFYLLYQLGTGGCTQKAELIQGIYPHCHTNGSLNTCHTYTAYCSTIVNSAYSYVCIVHALMTCGMKYIYMDQ